MADVISERLDRMSFGQYSSAVYALITSAVRKHWADYRLGQDLRYYKASYLEPKDAAQRLEVNYGESV